MTEAAPPQNDERTTAGARYRHRALLVTIAAMQLASLCVLFADHRILALLLTLMGSIVHGVDDHLQSKAGVVSPLAETTPVPDGARRRLARALWMRSSMSVGPIVVVGMVILDWPWLTSVVGALVLAACQGTCWWLIRTRRTVTPSRPHPADRVRRRQ